MKLPTPAYTGTWVLIPELGNARGQDKLLAQTLTISREGDLLRIGVSITDEYAEEYSGSYDYQIAELTRVTNEPGIDQRRYTEMNSSTLHCTGFKDEEERTHTIYRVSDDGNLLSVWHKEKLRGSETDQGVEVFKRA